MRCETAREYFSDLYENTLDANRSVQVEGHLKTCQECRAEFESFNLVYSAFEAFASEPAPAGLKPRVMSAFQAQLEVAQATRRATFWQSLREYFSLPNTRRRLVSMSAAALLLVGATAYTYYFDLNRDDVNLGVVKAPTNPSLKVGLDTVRIEAGQTALDLGQMGWEVVVQGDPGSASFRAFSLDLGRVALDLPVGLISTASPPTGMTYAGSGVLTGNGEARIRRTVLGELNVLLVQFTANGEFRYAAALYRQSDGQAFWSPVVNSANEAVRSAVNQAKLDLKMVSPGVYSIR